MIWQVLSSLAIAYGVALAQNSAGMAPTGTSPQLLTNQRVVLLAKAGYSEGSIIEIIQSKQASMDVSPEGLAWLVRQGLTERIIGAMVATQRQQEHIPPLPFHLIPTTPQTSPAENYVPQSRAGVQATPAPPASPRFSPWYAIPKLPVPASQVR